MLFFYTKAAILAFLRLRKSLSLSGQRRYSPTGCGRAFLVKSSLQSNTLRRCSLPLHIPVGRNNPHNFDNPERDHNNLCRGSLPSREGYPHRNNACGCIPKSDPIGQRYVHWFPLPRYPNVSANRYYKFLYQLFLMESSYILFSNHDSILLAHSIHSIR